MLFCLALASVRTSSKKDPFKKFRAEFCGIKTTSRWHSRKIGISGENICNKQYTQNASYPGNSKTRPSLNCCFNFPCIRFSALIRWINALSVWATASQNRGSKILLGSHITFLEQFFTLILNLVMVNDC